MQIIVKGEKSIAAIQQEFQREFPFLKIEFFPAKSADKSKASSNNTFDTYKTNSRSEELTITPSLTVAEVDKMFRTSYNLCAQILRKSGRAWLETTLTDNWTLEEQNEQGKSLST